MNPFSILRTFGFLVWALALHFLPCARAREFLSQQSAFFAVQSGNTASFTSEGIFTCSAFHSNSSLTVKLVNGQEVEQNPVTHRQVGNQFIWTGVGEGFSSISIVYTADCNPQNTTLFFSYDGYSYTSSVCLSGEVNCLRITATRIPMMNEDLDGPDIEEPPLTPVNDTEQITFDDNSKTIDIMWLWTTEARNRHGEDRLKQAALSQTQLFNVAIGRTFYDSNPGSIPRIRYVYHPSFFCFRTLILHPPVERCCRAFWGPCLVV